MNLKFEWNEEKARSNLLKHGVSFDEAKSVFYNPLARIFPDEDHSAREEREIVIGHSNRNRLLLVFFTEREDQSIRIFSARLATSTERKDYEENAYL